MIDTRHIDGPFFQNDPHPTAAWHAAVAEHIAEEFAPREHRK